MRIPGLVQARSAQARLAVEVVAQKQFAAAVVRANPPVLRREGLARQERLRGFRDVARPVDAKLARSRPEIETTPLFDVFGIVWVMRQASRMGGAVDLPSL